MKLLKFILIPFEYLYLIITTLKNFLYDSNILKSKKFDELKIISIGNISVGGSGKTPLVIFLANKLKQQGKNIAIVTRGYKSKVKTKVHLISAQDSASFVGDEPFMIYKNTGCKVVISKKRKDGIQYLKDNHKEITTVLLDDAMQHRKVFRDINVLCIDVGTKKSIEDFISNNLIPKGFLRESLYQGLKRTDIVVLNYRSQYIKNDLQIDKVKNLIPKGIPIYECFIENIKFLNFDYKESIIKKDIIVFCGISKPTNFYNTLKNLNYNLVKQYAFMDHKNFNDKDLEEIFSYAKENNCDVVCTEKDFVKLDDMWQKKCYFVKINPEFLNKEKFVQEFLK